MNKVHISATVDLRTIDDVREMAKSNKRSFSQMVDLLLEEAVKNRKRGERVDEILADSLKSVEDDWRRSSSPETRGNT